MTAKPSTVFIVAWSRERQTDGSGGISSISQGMSGQELFWEVWKELSLGVEDHPKWDCKFQK